VTNMRAMFGFLPNQENSNADLLGPRLPASLSP
jgi:hypothetical protein